VEVWVVKIIKCKPGESGIDNTSWRSRALNTSKKKCTYDGQEFESLQALAKFLKVSNMVIYHARKVGTYKGKKLELIK
jgi:hypothetical protein